MGRPVALATIWRQTSFLYAGIWNQVRMDKQLLGTDHFLSPKQLLVVLAPLQPLRHEEVQGLLRALWLVGSGR
jgi:hypothetical protein